MKPTDPVPEVLSYDDLASECWPREWSQVANVQSKHAREQRRRLRQRIEDLIAPSELPAAGVTQKPEGVSIATDADAFGLLVLIQESDQEQAISTRDYGKVREVIDMATDRTPLTDADGTVFLRPIFGVVVTAGVVEGACGLFPTQPWDSWETYLRGFFLFVGQAHRRSEHAKNLLQWSNWFADRSHMPVVWEVMHARTFDDRSRLFMRHASLFGGIFIHRPVEAVE